MCYFKIHKFKPKKEPIVKSWTRSIFAVAGLVLMVQAAAAGEWRTRFQAGPKITLGLKLWDSKGEMTWNHNASIQDPTLGNPTSKLTYRDIDSTVAEIMGRMALPQRFYLELVWGSGDIDDGSLVDEDFLSAFGAQFFGTTQSGSHLFSQTVSDVDAFDLHYYSLKLGRDVLSTDDKRGGIGVFGQLQYWSEKTRALGIRQLVCTSPNNLCAPAGFVGFSNTAVIENDVDWRSLFLGVDGHYDLNDKFSISGMLAWSPVAKVKNQDFHFLRADLAQDPSFELDGEGEAYSAEINLNYRFTPNFAGHAGLRYWKAKIEDERSGWSIFPSGGGRIFADLNELESERRGITIGASYTFGGRDASRGR